jgi:hypothetical protein
VTTVTFKAVLGRQRDARPAPRAPLPAAVPLAAQAAPEAPLSRMARLLALSYRVRRLLDSGALPDQREAAARLGIVFPQLTHMLNLTYLSPRIQERILSGELVLSEHALRPVCRLPSWALQEAALISH